MSSGQRTQIEADYFTTPIEELRERLEAIEGSSAASSSSISSYLRYDAVASALATYYAAATWDQEVTHVQYRSTIRYTPSYEDRNETSLDEASRTVHDYGWRPAADVSPETVELFSSYVEAIEEGVR